jgi:hypothetical protein
MSEFLARLFSTGKFPDPVCNYVVGTFSSRYLMHVTKNPSFLGHGAELFRFSNGIGDTRALLMMGDVTALDAVLGSDECVDTTLKAIMELWELSDDDQLRLVQRELPLHFPEWLLGNYALAPAARRYLLQHNRWGREFYFKRDAPARSESKLRADGHSWQHSRGDETKVAMAPEYRTEEYLTELYSGDKSRLSKLALVGRLDATGEFLSSQLGHGDNAESLAMWSAFFVLAEGGCDAPLTDVIGAAKTLALSK